MPLRDSLSNTWSHIQGFLFPMLRDEVGPLTDKQKQVVVVLEVARIEAFDRGTTDAARDVAALGLRCAS
jgi:hypothetical protein